MGQKSRFHFDIQAFNSGVTGSQIMVNVHFPSNETIRFLVDSGLYQEKDSLNQNESFAFDPKKIDFVLITHNHCDHQGRVPLLVKDGFYGPIFSSSTNCTLMPAALFDNCKVLGNLSKNKGAKSLYNDLDVEYSIQHFVGCKWLETVNFNPNIKLTFFKNGHLLGAALILVQISYPGEEDINILFTGDYNYKNIFFDVPQLPNWVLKLPLTIICEATYGNKNSTDIEYCFTNNIIRAQKNNSTIITPVFSQGRAQEVMFELKKMQENRILSTEVPIFLDGRLANHYTKIYQKSSDISPNSRDFIPENFTFVDKDLRENLIHNNESKIILTTSGMGSYGPAQTYLPEFITRRNALIHFTGYCADGTLGRRLIDCKSGTPVEIGGRFLKKNATVMQTSEFSAHAKADELIEFLNQFSSIKLLLIQHAEPETKEAFAARALDECTAKDVALLGNGYLFRVGRYGYLKSIPTKY